MKWFLVWWIFFQCFVIGATQDQQRLTMYNRERCPELDSKPGGWVGAIALALVPLVVFAHQPEGYPAYCQEANR